MRKIKNYREKEKGCGRLNEMNRCKAVREKERERNRERQRDRYIDR